MLGSYVWLTSVVGVSVKCLDLRAEAQGFLGLGGDYIGDYKGSIRTIYKDYIGII